MLQILCGTWTSIDTSWIGAFEKKELPKAATFDETLDDIIGSHVHVFKSGSVVVCRVAKRGPGTRALGSSAYPVTIEIAV